MKLKIYYIELILVLLAVAGVSSCVSNTEDVLSPMLQAEDVAVTFATNVGSAKDSRATYPSEESVGEMSTEKLQETGFGVFAHHHTEYNSSASGSEPFNFMWNQRVDYVSQGDYWTYDPLKYWPNDNNPADNQGATGSVSRSYLSFFAYAPYTDNEELLLAEESGDSGSGASGAAEDNADAADTDGTDTGNAADEVLKDKGIIRMTCNSTNSGGSYLTYHLSEKPFLDENVDLLWASRPNLWKMMDADEYGEHPGYVDGRVKFNFKHALSKLDIVVRGLFDQRDMGDNSADYPTERDVNTRILVKSVDFSDSPIMQEGKMYLVPQPNVTTTVPYWELEREEGKLKEDLKLKLSVEDFDLNANLRDVYASFGDPLYYHDDYFSSTEEIPDSAFAKLQRLPIGVTDADELLLAKDDASFLVIPNKDYVDDNPMKVHIVYYVITYDQNLKLNDPQYLSIVENDITATFSNAFSFAPNTQYKLRLLLGLTTVKFELEKVDGWETPLDMDPVVIDWHIERKEIDIE